MSSQTRDQRTIAASAWFRLNGGTLEAVTAVALFAATASFYAMASGAEELVVPIAVLAVCAILFGLALACGFASLEANGVPLVE